MHTTPRFAGNHFVQRTTSARTCDVDASFFGLRFAGTVHDDEDGGVRLSGHTAVHSSVHSSRPDPPTGPALHDDPREAYMSNAVTTPSDPTDQATYATHATHADAPSPTRTGHAPLAAPRADAPDGAWQAELAVRNREIARRGVYDATRILAGRYRLPDPAAGFTLLRQASQRHNVKLHTVADAVNHVRAPASPEAWFPGRRRPAPPVASALHWSPVAGRTREWQYGDFTKQVLRQSLAVAGAQGGSVHVIESDLLRLEHQQNLDGAFSDCFAFVRDTDSPAYWHLASAHQVTVPDLRHAGQFLGAAPHTVLLRSGARACHSVPLLDGERRLMGVVWAHYAKPLPATLGDRQLMALDTLSTQAGAWLSWHRRTVVLDALEDLHRLATHYYPTAPRTG